jgi:hypothetical protein
MAAFDLTIGNFIEATETTNCTVGRYLYGALVPQAAGVRVPPVSLIPGATQLRLPDSQPVLEALFLPLYGPSPHALRVRSSVEGANLIGGADDEVRWVPAPTPRTQEMRNPAVYTLSLPSDWFRRWGGLEEFEWVVEVLDANNVAVPLDRVLFQQTATGAGHWVSRSLLLSSLLLEVSGVDATHQVLTPQGWQSVAGLPPGWSMEYAFGSGGEAGYAWQTALPRREDILRRGYDSMRVRILTPPSLGQLQALSSLRVRYLEEYATSNPVLPSRSSSSNLYVPRIQVLLDGTLDLTPFVTAVQGGRLQLAVPDARLDRAVYQTPLVRVMLDGNPAVLGRVTGVQREEYATGVSYSLEVSRLTDLLADSLDRDVVGADVDGVAGLDLQFSTDGGYIAHVVQHSPGVGVKPWLLDPAMFRPVDAWLQNATPKLVRLDSDLDWYQLYATTNKNLRGKLKDVAQANLLEFGSVAGHPALVPLVPQAEAGLGEVRAVVFNAVGGRYLPESRLYVPNLEYSAKTSPKSLAVQGLATTEDGVDSTVPVAIHHRSRGQPSRDFVVEVAWTSLEVDFQFTDAQGNAAVYVPGSVSLVHRGVDTVDLNPFLDPQVQVEFITEGLRLREGGVISEVNGYRGVLGVRVRATSHVAWTTFTLRFDGLLLYSASGERGEDTKRRATGRYLPDWFPTAVTEMGNLAARLPKDEELVENPFVTDYWLDNPALVGQVQQDANGDRYYELAGYRLYESQAARLADALALRRMLEVATIELRYVGHPGLRIGDFVGIARRPAGGEGHPVEAVDYFLVLDDFEVSLQAGGNVVTSMRCGYVGTLLGGQTTRDLGQLRWQESQATPEEVFFF